MTQVKPHHSSVQFGFCLLLRTKACSHVVATSSVRFLRASPTRGVLVFLSSPNGSRVSGGAGDFSAKTTPTVTQAASVTGDCDVPPPLPPGGDANPNLETLNLGTTPRRPRSPPGE